jgi:GTPase
VNAPLDRPRTGHVALAGLPNVGKSSLLNALVGSHLAIVSPKAQATRLPVVGVLTRGNLQLILHDLPGLLEPRYLLQTRMREAALERLAQVHVILHLHPAVGPPAPTLLSLGVEVPPEVLVRTVYTKADQVSSSAAASLASGGAWVVSAETGRGLDSLVDELARLVPEGPFAHDPEDVGVQPLRFFVTEYLREAAFETLEDEVPYAVAAEVEEFREGSTPVYIRVTLYVERASQKAIVIGRGGQTLRAIGTRARARLEDLIGGRVHLETWVKVLPNWRRQGHHLDRLGFEQRNVP